MNFYVPHRRKVFIGINVRKICDCQNCERFKPTIKYLSTGASYLKTILESSNPLVNGCLIRDTNLGPVHYRSDALPTELHRHLGNVPKSLRLIAKHWAREYREKTTPSRIFMPCNLSSCRVWSVWVQRSSTGCEYRCHQEIFRGYVCWVSWQRKHAGWTLESRGSYMDGCAYSCYEMENKINPSFVLWEESATWLL